MPKITTMQVTFTRNQQSSIKSKKISLSNKTLTSNQKTYFRVGMLVKGSV